MPIYEYTCQKCNKTFDHLARTMNGDQSISCPECGSPKTVRALSVFAVGSQSGGTSASSSSGDDAPMCGRCGGAPGSCAMD